MEKERVAPPRAPAPRTPVYQAKLEERQKRRLLGRLRAERGAGSLRSVEEIRTVKEVLDACETEGVERGLTGDDLEWWVYTCAKRKLREVGLFAE